MNITLRKKLLFTWFAWAPVFFMSLLVFQLPPKPAKAAYDGSRIIDNAIFLDAASMNQSQIQSFLSQQSGTLDTSSFLMNCDIAGQQAKAAYLSLGAPCGQTVSASSIVYYSSQVYGLSPKVILATLQKEQSLITDPYPIARQYAQAMGYACPTSGNCDDGSTFFYQIDNGTWALRFHYERANGNNTWWYASSSWVCGSDKNFYKPSLYPGQNVNFYDEDGVLYRTHYIYNAATSSLYCYTPHAYNNPQGLYGLPKYGTTGRYYTGSYNFVKSFEQWFGSTNGGNYVWRQVDKRIFTDNSKTVSLNQSSIKRGQSFYVQIKAKNLGNETWRKDVSRKQVNVGTSNPIDRFSKFCDPTWIGGVNCHRTATTVEQEVKPGEVGTFEFWMTSPLTPGVYNEYFNLVADGSAWFNDIGFYWQFTVNNSFSNNGDASPKDRLSLDVGGKRQLRLGERLMSSNGSNIFVLRREGVGQIYSNYRHSWNLSPNKGIVLALQSDGNLVLYNASGQPVWASGTTNGRQLLMQSDGNLVLYNASGQPVWASGTTSNNAKKWSLSANTLLFRGQVLKSETERYSLALQPDGNLVLYNPTGRPVWASGTTDGYVLAQQADGNLVLYNFIGRPVWASNRMGSGVITYLQTDGNFVSYDAALRPIWGTYTQNK